MDRYDEKAREICERIGQEKSAFITEATEALTAAILRAAAEMGKAGEPVRPTAPQPTATVKEVEDAVFSTRGEVVHAIRRALSALSPEQRAVMVAAIKETP